MHSGWSSTAKVYQPENIAAQGWVSQYDYDPKLVVETRRRLLDEMASEGTLLMGYHLPFPGLGRVTLSGSAWGWLPGADRRERLVAG